MKIEFKSIKARLTFWLLLVALLPLLVVTIVIYKQGVDSIRENAFNKLRAIRDLRVKEVNTWLNERLGDIRTISENTIIHEFAGVLARKERTPKDMDTIQKISDVLNFYIENNKDYEELFVVNTRSGKIEVSTDKFLEGQDRATRDYVTEPLRRGEIYISGVFYSKAFRKPTLVFSIPVHRLLRNLEQTVGILVFRVDLENSLYGVLLDRIGMGDTGETLIVNKDAVALNELRWHPQAPMKLKIDAEAAALASQGQTGVVESRDYRGEEVLAAFTHIPRAQWGFVAKQDLKEIYAPIRQMFWNILILLVIAVPGVYGLSSFLARKIARPVREMADVSKRLEAGDMTARNDIQDADEVGFLAESFNKMADAMASQVSMRRGVAELTEAMVGASELKEFRRALLVKLVEITDSDFGAYYLRNLDNDTFEHFTSVGVNADLLEPFDASILEGAFGKTLLTKSITHLKDIPEDSIFKFKTFVGAVLPKEIINIPIVIENKVLAIVALARLRSYATESLEIINRVWLVMHSAFSGLLANEKTKRLALELKSKNMELEAQAGELQAQTIALQQQSEELQQQNMELAFQRQQVEEANRLKSEFLSNMSHELRTPLNSIMALSRVLILQAKQKLSDEEGNFLEIIARNGKNLLTLINDILDLSKIEAGKMDLKPKPFTLGSTIDMIMESLEPIAAGKGIQMHKNVLEEIPPIESDEARVHQILQNIIGNAVKFTEKGHITVAARYDTQKVLVEVADTGIGISSKDLPLIFEEFRQLDGTASRKYEGTGLGLSIAYKAAQMLGGDLSVESTPGQGSTFVLSLPLVWPGAAAVYEPIAIRPPRALKEKQKTVLVVDDEPEVANTISRYLLQAGYNTITATSGEEALRLAEKYQPFAITLDIIMPDMDGWEVLQGVKKNPDTADIPVIIASVSQDAETGFALGAVGYITKPVDRDALMAEILKLGGATPHAIMVVDDHEVDREIIARFVNEEGMQAVVAQDGAQCLELIQESVPDVLVLDLMMPGMDGFEVLERLRNDPDTHDLPVIVVTAKDLTAAEKRELSGKVSAVIGKSGTTLTPLLEEIKEILGDIERQPKHRLQDTGSDGQAKREVAVPPETPHTAADTGSITGMPTILVVEDNPDNMITIKAVLGKEYHILEANDGEEGLKTALTGRPDLVLLDMALPKMDGLTVARKIKAHETASRIPVIALTAKAMKGDREKIVAAGCNDYISKPFDPEELVRKVADRLRK